MHYSYTGKACPVEGKNAEHATDRPYADCRETPRKRERETITSLEGGVDNVEMSVVLPGFVELIKKSSLGADAHLCRLWISFIRNRTVYSLQTRESEEE